MDVLGDLLVRDRDVEGTVLHVRVGGRDRRYEHREVVATASRAANLLRHLGVRPGSRVDVTPELLPQPIFTFLGAALVGAATRFDLADGGGARAVVTNAEMAATLALSPGSKLVVYGNRPDDPGTTHWETDVWSENPATPRESVRGTDPVLVGERSHSHETVLASSREVADAFDLGPGVAVAVRSPLSDPRTVVAGLVAPLLVGGTVVLPDGEDSVAGDVAVSNRTAPEPVQLSPDAVSL